MNYDEVDNLFVIEAVGGVAHVRLDNIRIVCPAAAECDLDPVFTNVIDENFFIFDDAVTAEWSNPGVLFYKSPFSGPIEWDIVADVDDATNDVLQFEFGVDGDHNSTMYIQSSEPKDLTAFADGNLVFELKVVDAAANTSGFLVKADCVYPCGSVTVPVAMPTVGVWETITIPVTGLSGLDLSNVDTPISFFPVGGEQNGVIFQLDNIRWELPTP